MTIHERLRQLRQTSGLTQEQVAQQIGLTRQALSSYESGRTRPDIETLMKLAEIYGNDLEGILYGNEAPDIQPPFLCLPLRREPFLCAARYLCLAVFSCHFLTSLL